MEKKELLKCIHFFKTIKVVEQEVTTEEEKAQHYKVVKVTYIYKEQSYTTKKLYYKHILHQEEVKNPQNIITYFGENVFWLDYEKHDWPKGRGEAELEKTIIDEMAEESDTAFKELLKSIANNNKTGYIQLITAEGKTNQYHHNLENNNHWHDIILLIQEIINKKGAKVHKRFFSRLVFRWDGNKNTVRERSSLAKEAENTSRAFIDNLYKNIASIQHIFTTMELNDLLIHKKQIILQGPPGTGKTRKAKDIAEQLIFNEISNDKEKQKLALENSEQFKIIQFHPAYSYEDFVRGIVVSTDTGSTPEYKTVNKILGEFAKKANESNLQGGNDDFDKAWFALVEDINNGIVTKIGSSDVEVDINTQGNIRFKSPVATYEKTYELYKVGKTDLKYETYNKIVLNYLKDSANKYKLKDYIPPKSINSTKPYILIIDEINRANLPVVLGELIYALEYRGEKVESMYATLEEGNTLILPSNLYIIGTMNTSDRSIGHIDYAIRRRFAFIDVLPKILEGDAFELELFKQVSTLFVENFDEYVKDNTVPLKLSEHLSEEFRPEDVWLGHSYFIKGKEDFSLRKKYEIIPILKEYIKDGILKQSATAIINAL
ncbi:McrB family protein [Tenacibaculum sp. TC6]|uniref:McrB family protein n=1 Tax=Tenacibaculum sp. TC6 TaxID=3423223 RepID=UPI003D36CD3B